MPNDETLNDWMDFGDKKTSLDDEDLFTEGGLLLKMLQLKTQFDSLDGKQLMKARSRANPYEQLKCAIFQNRAALKMADMDYATGFIFSGIFVAILKNSSEILYLAFRRLSVNLYLSHCSEKKIAMKHE